MFFFWNLEGLTLYYKLRVLCTYAAWILQMSHIGVDVPSRYPCQSTWGCPLKSTFQLGGHGSETACDMFAVVMENPSRIDMWEIMIFVELVCWMIQNIPWWFAQGSFVLFPPFALDFQLFHTTELSHANECFNYNL